MVEVQRRTKTQFQQELDKVITDRNSRGFGTGFSDNDGSDYDDDFDENDDDFDADDFLKQYSKPDKSARGMNKTRKMEWKVPEYSDDSDVSDEIDSSKFLKNAKKTPEKSEKFPKTFARQQAVSRDNSRNKIEPVLSPRSKKTPVSSPQHSISSPRRVLSPSSDKSERLVQNPLANSGSFSSERNREKRELELKKKVRGRERVKKEEGDVLESLFSSKKEEDNDLESIFSSKNKEGDGLDSLFSSKKEKGNELENLLASIKSESKENNNSSKNSQSLIDFLMDDDSAKPKPAPRKQNSLQEKYKKSESLILPSPVVDSSTKRRSRKKSEDSKQDFLNLETVFGAKNSSESKKNDEIDPPKSAKSLEVANNSSDDLLTLFQQTQIDSEANIPLTVEDKQTLLNDDQNVEPKQGKQAINDAIDNVASHNNEVNLRRNTVDSENEKPEQKVKKKRVKTGVKSYRTPPVGYKGLGSTTSLKQLKRFDSSLEVTADSSLDIRNSVYLEWLEKREKKKREEKKAEEIRATEESEKKVREKKEKEEEARLTRDAWMEKKSDMLKAQEKVRRRREKKERNDKREKEEERWKSEKKADARRKSALEEARRRHKEEKRREETEKVLACKREEEKKEESEKAAREWKEKKEERLKKERKEKAREEREKKRKAVEEERAKKKAAEEKYEEWRRGKEERTVHHPVVEERPTWSPANKVIPRVR